MSADLEIGKESMPSVLKDPFKKTCVKKILVYFQESDFTKGQWYAWGKVYFTNGNTKGEQDFNGETFDEVTLKIREFINNELK